MKRTFLLGAVAVSFALPTTVSAKELAPKSPVKAEGFTSPIHKKHAGKVLFSKKPVPRAPKTDTDFVTSFTLGKDPIYLRPFLADSMENLLRAKGWECYKARRREAFVAVNGGKREWIELKNTHKDNFNDWTTWSLGGDGKLHLTKGPFKFGMKDDFRQHFATKVVPQLKEGANQVEVIFGGECYARGAGYEIQNWDVAKATFTLNVPKGGVAAFIKTMGPHLPKHKLKKGKKLAKAMKKTVEAKWTNEEVLAVRTTSDEWFVKLNKYTGRPMSRSVNTIVVVRKKGATNCRAFDLSFYQQSKGLRNKFQKAMTFGVGSSRPFPCANAK